MKKNIDDLKIKLNKRFFEKLYRLFDYFLDQINTFIDIYLSV